MRYYSTSDFQNAFATLVKKPKNGYGALAKDICGAFCGKSMDEIRHNRDMVLDETAFSIIKLRIPNSQQGLSKSNGYRLIYYVHKQKGVVAFIYVYPKRGPMGLITVKQNEIIHYLENLIKENNASLLIELDINNALSVIAEHTKI